MQLFEGPYYASLNENDQLAVQDRLREDIGYADKTARVAMAVADYAKDGDYEQFCRFMLSVGEYYSNNGKQITMNYVHQIVLVPMIPVELRTTVGNFYKRFYQFDGLLGLMNLAENSLNILGLKPTDEQTILVTLASWEKAIQRIVFLAKYQRTPCR